MQFKNVLNSRVAAIGAGAAVLAVLAGGTGYAAGQIDSSDVKNESLRGVDIKDGKLGLKELAPSAVKQLQGQDGKDGKDGVALADAYQSESAQTIEKIGGSFVANKTELGEITLQPGVYVLNGFAAFDTAAADSPRTDGTHLQLALRGPAVEGNNFGADYGTCFTGAFPQGDREATCQVVRTVRITEATTVDVIAFGYNEDTSDTGSGTFKVTADVSALKIA
jgi:hypothetical protein